MQSDHRHLFDLAALKDARDSLKRVNSGLHAEIKELRRQVETFKEGARVSDVSAEHWRRLWLEAQGGDFAKGVVSMCRNTLPAIRLIRQGRWTLDDMERWVEAVISNDASYLSEAVRQIEAPGSAFGPIIVAACVDSFTQGLDSGFKFQQQNQTTEQETSAPKSP